MKYRNKTLIPGFNVEQELKDQIIEVCKKRRISLNEFLNKAVSSYLNLLNRK